ncbi:MAG: ABC transporter ATP-binding protein [Desulfobacterales bacterium]|nr:MAG: ABC transporter ATP-binding protein [Desulfobacterales bacterium]
MKNIIKLKIGDRYQELLLLVKDNWIRLALSSVSSALVAATTAATAYLVKPALDNVFIKKDLQMLMVLPIIVVVVVLIKGLAAYWQEFLLSYVGQNILRNLKNRLYDHMQSLPLSFFQKAKTGDLMSRITSDVNVVNAMFTSVITGGIRDSFTLIGLVFVVFYLIPKLAIFAFLVLPFAFFPIVHFGRRIRRVRKGTQEAVADMNAFLHETLSGNKIVKAFSMEDHEKKRFFQKTHKIFRLELKEARVKALSAPLMEFLGGLGGAIVIGYGGYLVIVGNYTTGTFMSFLAAVFMMYHPLKNISKLNNSVQQGLAAIDRIFDILERKSDVVEAQHPIAIARQPHRVTFENVFFKYESTMVLQNINLDVQPGEILALVGTSGGGKTSLVNLIPRFYDVSQGAICIDGIDIRQASISSLRNQIAIVTQEPILFNDTVRYNIAYGNANATESDIVEAATAAYAYDFIQGFPREFETMIGELGGRLSGGQKQRICIARALLKNAPILILDEATSSLDSESETLVQRALENLMKGRTTFVIAHRLSTIGYADRIVVIVDGQIAEEGKHEELIARQGEYYKLHQMQYSGDNQHDYRTEVVNLEPGF